VKFVKKPQKEKNKTKSFKKFIAQKVSFFTSLSGKMFFGFVSDQINVGDF